MYERIILSGGLAVIGAILGKRDFVKRQNILTRGQKRNSYLSEQGLDLDGEGYEIYLPMILTEGLQKFLEHEGISTGLVFVASRGTPVDRSYVWRELKTLG